MNVTYVVRGEATGSLPGLGRFQQRLNFTFIKLSQPNPSVQSPTSFVRSACRSTSLRSSIMDGEKNGNLSGQPLPGATIPLDSNGAHSGDSEVKKRARSNSPAGEIAEGHVKRVKGVAPIKAE